MKIRVVYDNREFEGGFETGWGFSCLIESKGKYLLFDTGDSGEKLLKNLNKTCVDLNKIEAVTISHDHWDHTGGLDLFLKENRNAKVYIPYNFSKGIKEMVKDSNHSYETVGVNRKELIPDVFSTPVFARFMRPKEQGLVLIGSKGLALITGCAHPNILFMVKEVKRIFYKDVKFILGGFHLHSYPSFHVREIIKNLFKEGVEYFAPAHCTGDRAISIFEKECGSGFIKVGSGKEIEWR